MLKIVNKTPFKDLASKGIIILVQITWFHMYMSLFTCIIGTQQMRFVWLEAQHRGHPTPIWAHTLSLSGFSWSSHTLQRQSPPLYHNCAFSQWLQMRAHESLGPHLTPLTWQVTHDDTNPSRTLWRRSTSKGGWPTYHRGGVSRSANEANQPTFSPIDLVHAPIHPPWSLPLI